MSLRPSWRPDLPNESFPEDRPSQLPSPSSDPAQTIAEVAARLAHAGGGALSVDLALDLILNDIVEQARRATRASGAAIALARDREMICRATAGNAPELGTPVDTSSGLSAACLKTGEVQQCSDTECDPRVDREACHDLDIRSMLLVPIMEDGSARGILEVFSSLPNNFNSDHAETLQPLTGKILNAKKAAESRAQQTSTRELEPPLPEQQAAASVVATVGTGSSDVRPISVNPESEARNEVLSFALIVLVVAAAVLLGLVIGVRQMAKHAAGAQIAVSPKDASALQTSAAPPIAPAVPASAPQVSKNAVPSAAAPPEGGLIVTQNGKVIYRDEPSAKTGSTLTTNNAGGRLLRRIDPIYPETAKSQHIQGAVVLEAQVLSDGTVGNVAILQGDPVLAQAATEAVKQWKYQPYYVKGQPVERQERITVKFSLPSS